jgi:hypothetical protein
MRLQRVAAVGLAHPKNPDVAITNTPIVFGLRQICQYYNINVHYINDIMIFITTFPVCG